MTPRERLLHRADELDDEALMLRFVAPVDCRTLRRVAADLRDIAVHLPTPTRETT